MPTSLHLFVHKASDGSQVFKIDSRLDNILQKTSNKSESVAFIPVPTWEEKCPVWAHMENKCTEDCKFTVPKLLICLCSYLQVLYTLRY